MKIVYERATTSTKLVGVEKEIKKALEKIYRAYVKAGAGDDVYLSMSILEDEDGVHFSANNNYFDKGTFASKNELQYYCTIEK